MDEEIRETFQRITGNIVELDVKVTKIQKEMVTKGDLEALQADMVTKGDLEALQADMVTKEYLKEALSKLYES